MLHRTLILILYSVCTSGSLRQCFKLKWNSISLYILFVFSVKLHSRCIRFETQRYKENVSIRSLPLKEKYLLLCHKGVTTHQVCPSGRPLKPVLTTREMEWVLKHYCKFLPFSYLLCSAERSATPKDNRSLF